MKESLTLAAAFAGAVLALPASATDVGVSVHVNQPGLYGRIDIGAVPPPPVALVYPQPVLVAATPVVVQPVYLHVPPGHAKNWRKHCHKYDACGQRVYFVKDSYWQQHYARSGRDDDDRGHGHGHGDGHKHKHKHEGKGKGKDKD